ncbi:MAG: hypothetical protein FE78DRAFT_27294 [Acidomyces sp. 'richmondensis']|nr:MAG: hypothetical protein FE78DRAFT_27294 [Acidomyces sp. 'richmondensis']
MTMMMIIIIIASIITSIIAVIMRRQGQHPAWDVTRPRRGTSPHAKIWWELRYLRLEAIPQPVPTYGRSRRRGKGKRFARGKPRRSALLLTAGTQHHTTPHRNSGERDKVVRWCDGAIAPTTCRKVDKSNDRRAAFLLV